MPGQSCDECQKPAIRAVQSDKEVEERCNYYMSQFTKRIDTLEKEMVNKAEKADVDVISKKLEEFEKNGPPQAEALSMIEEKFVELRRDQEEIERRRTNLIIYDVEEPTHVDDRDRRRVDAASVTTMLTKLNLQEIELKAVTRLDKKTEGRNRPIKVILNTERDKVKELSRMQELRQSREPQDNNLARDSHITTDLSQKQRSDHRALVQQMEKRRQEGEEDMVIRGGRIIKRKPFRVRQASEAANN